MVRNRRRLRKCLALELLEDRLCPSGYRVADLGANLEVGALNDSGQFAASKAVSGGFNAYLGPDSGNIPNTLGGDNFSRGYGINGLGVLVGDAETIPRNQWQQNHVGASSSHAFRFENGIMEDLGTFSPFIDFISPLGFHIFAPAESAAFAINEQ